MELIPTEVYLGKLKCMARKVSIVHTFCHPLNGNKICYRLRIYGLEHGDNLFPPFIEIPMGEIFGATAWVDGGQVHAYFELSSSFKISLLALNRGPEQQSSDTKYIAIFFKNDGNKYRTIDKLIDRLKIKRIAVPKSALAVPLTVRSVSGLYPPPLVPATANAPRLGHRPSVPHVSHRLSTPQVGRRPSAPQVGPRPPVGTLGPRPSVATFDPRPPVGTLGPRPSVATGGHHLLFRPVGQRPLLRQFYRPSLPQVRHRPSLPQVRFKPLLPQGPTPPSVPSINTITAFVRGIQLPEPPIHTRNMPRGSHSNVSRSGLWTSAAVVPPTVVTTATPIGNRWISVSPSQMIRPPRWSFKTRIVTLGRLNFVGAVLEFRDQDLRIRDLQSPSSEQYLINSPSELSLRYDSIDCLVFDTHGNIHLRIPITGQNVDRVSELFRENCRHEFRKSFMIVRMIDHNDTLARLQRAIMLKFDKFKAQKKAIGQNGSNVTIASAASSSSGPNLPSTECIVVEGHREIDSAVVTVSNQRSSENQEEVDGDPLEVVIDDSTYIDLFKAAVKYESKVLEQKALKYAASIPQDKSWPELLQDRRDEYMRIELMKRKRSSDDSG